MEYWYDANGMRVKTVEGSSTTEYVYQNQNPSTDKAGRIYSD